MLGLVLTKYEMIRSYLICYYLLFDNISEYRDLFLFIYFFASVIYRSLDGIWHFYKNTDKFVIYFTDANWRDWQTTFY